MRCGIQFVIRSVCKYCWEIEATVRVFTRHQTNPMHLTNQSTLVSERSTFTPEKRCNKHRSRLKLCEHNDTGGGGVF